MVKHIEGGISGRMLGSNSLFWMRDIAARLQIKGVVFMQPDGSIRVKAEGEEDNLKEFTEKIKRGKVFSELENFYIRWSDPVEDLGNFFVAVN